MIPVRSHLAEGSMQLLHLTDLHYSRNSPFQVELIKRLVEDLKKLLASGVAPDLVIFSGDLVNNPDEPDIYEEFETKFLEPVLEAISLRPNDVIFCPGNHDVSRKAIVEWSDERKSLSYAMQVGQPALDELLRKAPVTSYARSLSSSFFDLVKRCGHEWADPFSHVYEFPSKSVSFVSLNTGFGCGLEGSQHDRGRLALSATKVLEAFQKVTSGHKIYSLMHHTLADLNEHSTRLFTPLLFKHSDVHLFGHVHQPNPITQIGQGSSCFTVQGGALYEREGQYNGYSVISVAEKESFTSVAYRTYWVDRHEFDVGTNVTSGGTFYNSLAAQSYWTNLVPQASNDDVGCWLLETLDSVSKELDKTITSKTLRDIFVEPIVKKSTPEDEVANRNQRVTIEDILTSGNHTVISAANEHGGTSLLSYITMAFHEQCVNLPKAFVPAFVDARRIRGAYDAAVSKVLRDADLPLRNSSKPS